MIVYLKFINGAWEIHAIYTWPDDDDNLRSLLIRYDEEKSARDYAEKMGWKVVIAP